ncbi:uncharacterized protein LOC113552655 [Rhopalosiphum maidis]|uniref:uncharacterized protein LOC113552655 n=1 Tax=Rhopalosiphum maidis TaxID=43146 RepID=UPI000EFF5CE9|nr:uncharacterized protein LOC113552655 [Rhopalosiphum maidis]
MLLEPILDLEASVVMDLLANEPVQASTEKNKTCEALNTEPNVLKAQANRQLPRSDDQHFIEALNPSEYRTLPSENERNTLYFVWADEVDKYLQDQTMKQLIKKHGTSYTNCVRARCVKLSL